MQLGAREHYALPRALHGLDRLNVLFTDVWMPSSSKSGVVGSHLRRLHGRFSADLQSAKVVSGGMRWIAADSLMRASNRIGAISDWSLLLSRNALFDRAARVALTGGGTAAAALFAYSYAATTTSAEMSRRGRLVVMGQIDGGPHEEEIVLTEMSRYPMLGERYRAAPKRYWDVWRQQCENSTVIVVNSPWARYCLERSGIPGEKLVTVPLFFQRPATEVVRPAIPVMYSPVRPLRVLFLGQLNLRKGAGRLFDTIRLVRGESIEFWLVGPQLVNVPEDIRSMANVRLHGPVERSQVAEFYRNADVFLLPTLSDGYAITQLEALSFGMPVVASKFCGSAVLHGENGVILDDLQPETISACLRDLVKVPERIAAMSRNCRPTFASLREYGQCFLEAVCR